VAPPAFAAARLLVLSAGQQSIDISCSIAGPTAANPQQRSAAGE